MLESFSPRPAGNKRQPAARHNGFRPARRFEVTVFLTAAVLAAVSAVCALLHWQWLGGIAGERFRLLVAGPGKLVAGVPVDFVVESSDVTGRAVPAEVSFGLYHENGRRMILKDVVGADGRVRFTLPVEELVPGNARVEVAAEYRNGYEQALFTVPISPAHFVAHAELSETRCHPGDTLFYRVGVFSAWELVPAQRLSLLLEVLPNDGDGEVAWQHTTAVNQGVATGLLKVDASCTPGRYLLRIRGKQAEVICPAVAFQVVPRREDSAEAFIVFDRSSYSPGDDGELKVLYRSGGKPQDGASLQLLLRSGTETVYRTQGVTDAAGQWAVTVPLPATPPDEPLVVEVYRTGDEGEPLAAESLPLDDGSTLLRFFPEGGVLVPDVENRVYFLAEDRFGNPLEVTGTVADSRGDRVALLRTLRPGLGSFTMVPLPGEQYEVETAPPRAVQKPVRLPVAVAEDQVAVNAGLGVFGAEEPLRFALRTSRGRLPLAAVVWCRGLPIACQTMAPSAANHSNGQEIPLPDGVFGLMRLVIYNCRSNPPQAVAERLVYRRPPESRRLRVQLVAGRREYRSGEMATVEVEVRDNHQQAAEAILAATAVEDAATGSGQSSDHPLAQLVFGNRSERPSDQIPWESDGRFEQRNEAVALDLWLGTRTQAILSGAGSSPEATVAGRQSGDWPSGLGQAPLLVFDNLDVLQRQFRDGIERRQSGRAGPLRIVLRIAAVASLGLLLLVAMIAVLGISTSVWPWAAGLAAATVCVAVDSVALQMEGNSGGAALVPYASQEHQGPEFQADGAGPETVRASDSAPESTWSTSDKPKAWFDFQSAGPTPAQTAGHSTLLFWNPEMQLGEGGRGVVRFELPGYPGRCRVTVGAHNQAGAFGFGELSFPWGNASAQRPGEPP